MISAVMLTGSNQPTLGRDTMFAVTMIVLNGLVGLALIVGGLKHREQSYNLRGANAYLAVILPLAILGLVLPSFTQSTDDGTLTSGQAIIFIITFLVLYLVFLAIQTVRHRELFINPKSAEKSQVAVAGSVTDHATVAPTGDKETPELPDGHDDEHEPDSEHDEHAGLVLRPVWVHSVLLLAYLIPVVILSKQLAYPIDYAIEVSQAPVALGGFIVALLILSPEAMSGLRAAANNKLQRSVNLYLGSIAATIGLTIPAILMIGLVTGNSVILGLDPTAIILLAITLAVSMLTFESKRTNVLHGAVHLVLFATYLVVLFD